MSRQIRGRRAAVVLLMVALLAPLLLPTQGCWQSKGRPKLRIWQTETDKAAGQRLTEAVEEFKRRHPDVDVELESVAWSALSTKLAVAIQAHNEPDVTHLEPFMAASLKNRDLLLPIDDVIETIERENADKIYDSVRDLQLYDGRRYGIAYAIGTTSYAYRKDWAQRLNLSEPRTWDEYVNFAKQLHEASNGQLKVLLPGGDPFFIDQLFAELVANNGGRLFDPATNRPQLNTPQVRQALEFLRRLAPYVDPGWQTQSYLDQFNRFARGEAGNVPVTYARAAKAIESALKSQGPDVVPRPNPEYFALMSQPIGPSHTGPPVATIDCEPYVIFKSAEARPDWDPGQNAKLAKEFLAIFYDRKYYLPFVREVPIHLTPIFRGMAESPDYLTAPMIEQWRPWYDQTAKFLNEANRTRPILMPDNSDSGRKVPFLLDFQSSRILTQAVTEVMTSQEPPESTGQVAQAAADNAQKRAEQLVESLGFRRW